MFYILSGFIFGCLIPYISRRFQKFMPATFAYALYKIVKPNKQVAKKLKKTNLKYVKLAQKYFYHSLLWGVLCAILSAMAYQSWGERLVIWHLMWLWILLLAAEIDWRMYLLPDILTVPLLIAGFLYASLASGWVIPPESSIGATVGYVMPLIASMCLVWKNKEMFGGGDIKLLAALGAWMGADKLIYVILCSIAIFGLYALIRQQRSGAFGPAIVMSAIMVAFYCF